MRDRMSGCIVLMLFLGAAGVIASGRISSIAFDGDEVEITVETTMGHRYQPMCTTNLISGVWADLGREFMAAADVTTLRFPQEAVHCYLRIVKTDPAEGPPPPEEEPPPPPL